MSWLSRLVNTLRASQVEHELDEELRFHVEERASDLMRRGLDPSAATAQAARELGAPWRHREASREIRVIPWLESVSQDARYGVRALRTNPGFAATAAITLALGIGATTAMFSTVHATLLRPFPYPDWDEIRAVRQQFTDGAVTSGLLAPVEMARLNTAVPSVRAAGGTRPVDATRLRPDGTAVTANVQAVVGRFFEVFALPMALGTGFTPAHHVVGGPDGVIVAHRVWRTEFGGDPNIVGRTIRFADGEIRVLGVAAPAFDVPRGTEFWVNGKLSPLSTAHNFESYLRINGNVNPKRLAGELEAVFDTLARELPGPETGRAFLVSPLVTAIVGDLGPTLVIVFGATALLLGLACVNVTNLLFVRAAGRTREIAIREAMGATRGRLVRQLLVESMTLASIGATAGLALAYGGVQVLQRLGASALPRLDTIPFDGPVFLFTIAVLLTTTVLIGLAPAFRLARPHIAALVNEGGRMGAASRRTSRVLGAMTIAEVSLAITLVAGAAWLVRSFDNLRRSDTGFSTAGRLVFDVELARTRYQDPKAAIRELLTALEAVPGVARAASTTVFPMRTDTDSITPLAVNGYTDPDRAFTAYQRIVSPGFFDAMGVTLVSGRVFTDADRRDTMPVVVVNEAFVRQFGRGADPAQMQITFGFPRPSPESERPVVGVVRDVKYASPSLDAQPAFYLPQEQWTTFSHTMVVSTTLADPSGLIPAIRERMRRFDPLLAVDMLPADAVIADTLQRQRLGMMLMLLFGAIALALAAVGIHGVTAYAAAQRRVDVAMRMALGATASSIFWSTIARSGPIAALGASIGLATAYAAGRTASSWLYHVSPSDPRPLGLALALVLGILLAATVQSARKASRITPMTALRGQ